MANGFKSVHPLTEEALRNLGVKSAQVTQGWGSAPASVGFHAAVGTCQGRKYGPCVDLDWELADIDFLNRLWEAGFVAFDRCRMTGWSGAEHIHCIHIGLVDDAGHAHLPDGPRRQVVDFLKQPPRDGLAGHQGLLRGYLPTVAAQAELRKQYAGWLPDYPTAVLAPGGQQITCYAWMDGEAVTAEVTAFCNWWGVTVAQQTGMVCVNGERKAVLATTFDGRFYRAPVRAMAELLGLKVASYKLNAAKTAATVQLAY